MFLKNIQLGWILLPFRTFQGTLSTGLLNRPKCALRKSKVTVLLTPVLTSQRTKNSTISWSRCSRWPPIIISPRSLVLFINHQSTRTPSPSGSLSNYVRCFPLPLKPKFLWVLVVLIWKRIKNQESFTVRLLVSSQDDFMIDITYIMLPG